MVFIFPLICIATIKDPVDQLPENFKLMSNYIKRQKLHVAEIVKLNKAMDIIIGSVDKDDYNIINKIIKRNTILTIFNNLSVNIFPDDIMSKQTINNVERKLKKTIDSIDRYIAWIILSVIKDLKIIITDSNISTYKQNINKNIYERDKQYQLIRKKILLLYPIVAAFTEKDTIYFNNTIKDLAISTVQKISNRIMAFYLLTNKSIKPNLIKQNKYFSQTNKQLLKTNSQKNTKIEKLIDKIINNIKTKNLDEIDSWIPKTDPEYIAPKKLPVAINNWDIMPTPNPEYNTPSILPIPTNEWYDGPQFDPNYIPPHTIPAPSSDWKDDQTLTDLETLKRKLFPSGEMTPVPNSKDAEDNWITD